MSGACTYDRIPPHLRRYVLVQDYDRYDEVDQQVWRYVLSRIFARLRTTAHPAYVKGLEQTGISIDRIPNLAEMDRRLGDFGWGAVCVDGFLPPRAFQEFQALGILPINAEIRTPEHVRYTPAPDIIHEAAGHAPILPEPRYADYLRRVGRIGSRAFASIEDQRVYEAIYELSEVKESPKATHADVARSERKLARALGGLRYVSEAAKMSRLYWWTAEYGLVGHVDRYVLYGAGLLSSLGESESCHDASVRKLPLSAACVEVDYDITREQPQLFVARDFEHLHEVLEEVAATLAFRIGGDYALAIAQKSAEVATVELDSGVEITGRVAAVERSAGGLSLVRMAGRVGIGTGGKLFEGYGGDAHPDGLAIPMGPLADGTLPSRLRPEHLAALCAGGSVAPGAPLEARFRSGITLRGRFVACARCADGRLGVVRLADAELVRDEGGALEPRSARFDWAVGGAIATAYAGAADPLYWPPTEPSHERVPVPREPRSAVVALDAAPSVRPAPLEPAGAAHR